MIARYTAMIKKVIPAVLLAAIGCLGFATESSEPFSYRYEIRANSASVQDQMMLYTYKELLVDTYDETCLSLPQSYHDQAVREHIADFSIEGKTTAKLSYGTIVVKVGSGLGPSIRGDLRRSVCDEEVVNTKFFFFEIFSH